MNRRLFLAAFERERDILAATRAVRENGYRVEDVYAPYPVHGLPQAMGLQPSRLPMICFLCGATGAVIAMVGQWYLSAVDWPLNVGGKPWNSTLAFVPIAFELTILLGGLGLVAAFLIGYRLWPGKKPMMPHPGVTDDRFVLVVIETDAACDVDRLRSLCEGHGAIWTRESVEGGRPLLRAAGKEAA